MKKNDRDLLPTPDEFLKELESKKDIPEFTSVVAKTFRSAMEALDEDVIEPIGVLTLIYTESGKPIDPFFRAVGGTLSDLVHGELKMLRELTCKIQSVESKSEFLLIGSYRQDADVYTTRVFELSPGRHVLEILKEQWPPMPEWRRLYSLLINHQLAEPFRPAANAPNDTIGIVANRATVQRLAEIVLPR